MRLLPNVNPTVSSLRPIASFFNISIDQLLGEQPLPSDRLPGTHNPVIYATSLLPVIEWHEVQTYLNDQCTFLKHKSLKWISSEQEFSEKACAIIINTNSYGLFLKKNSLILVEPKKPIIDGGLSLFITNQKANILLRHVLIDGDKVYIRSINPEMKGVSLLPENFKFLGSVIEIRYAFQTDTETTNADFIKTKNLAPVKVIRGLV